jgi:prophage regulatory protein
MTTQLLSYADLRARGVPYSKSQIYRLWHAGKFPKPVRLSAVRLAWPAVEVDEWIAQKLSARDQAVA